MCGGGVSAGSPRRGAPAAPWPLNAAAYRQHRAPAESGRQRDGPARGPAWHWLHRPPAQAGRSRGVGASTACPRPCRRWAGPRRRAHACSGQATLRSREAGRLSGGCGRAGSGTAGRAEVRRGRRRRLGTRRREAGAEEGRTPPGRAGPAGHRRRA